MQIKGPEVGKPVLLIGISNRDAFPEESPCPCGSSAVISHFRDRVRTLAPAWERLHTETSSQGLQDQKLARNLSKWWEDLAAFPPRDAVMEMMFSFLMLVGGWAGWIHSPPPSYRAMSPPVRTVGPVFFTSENLIKSCRCTSTCLNISNLLWTHLMLFLWSPCSLVQSKGRACTQKRLLSVTAFQFICGRRSYLGGSQDLKGKVPRILHCPPPPYWFLMNVKVENKSFDHQSRSMDIIILLLQRPRTWNKAVLQGKLGAEVAAMFLCLKFLPAPLVPVWTITFYPLQSPHFPVLSKWGEIVHWEWLGFHPAPMTQSTVRNDCYHQRQCYSDCKVARTVHESVQLLTFRKVRPRPRPPPSLPSTTLARELRQAQETRSSKGGCLHLRNDLEWTFWKKTKGLLSRTLGSFWDVSAGRGADWRVWSPCAHLALREASLSPVKYTCSTLLPSHTLFKSATEFTVVLL